MNSNHRTPVMIALLLVLTAVSAPTDEPVKGKSAVDGPPAKLATLKVSSVKEKVGEIDTVTRVLITTDTNRFTFILPKRYRLNTTDAGQSLSLAPEDGSALIKLSITEQASPEPPELKAETVRQQLLDCHPDASVVEEFGASAGSFSGLGFELQWRPANGAMLNSRIAIIPFPGGTLEFSQTGLSQRIRELDQALNQLMLSFRRAPLSGKLDIAPLSDKL